MKYLFLDLDGVVVDLDPQFVKYSHQHWKDLPAEERWEIIYKVTDSNEYFFLDAPFLSRGYFLFVFLKQWCEKHNVVLEILTSTGLYNINRITLEKKLWVCKNLCEYTVVNTVSSGESKHEFVCSRESKNPNDYLLIDDLEKNHRFWKGPKVLYSDRLSINLHLMPFLNAWRLGELKNEFLK